MGTTLGVQKTAARFDRSIAVPISSNDRIMLTVFWNLAFFSLLLIAAPHNAHMDVDTKAVNAKNTANKTR